MKPIRIPQTAEATLLDMFKDYITKNKNADGRINFNMNMADLVELPKEKPTIRITSDAYLKMMSLVKASDKELAWHGTVEHTSDFDYSITDILVYPQEVTGVTVTSCDDKYPEWINKLEDATINKLRFQGHSHVNMTASPSGVDTNNWEEFLSMIEEDGYYIFCIANKRHEIYCTLYDMKNNAIFEPKDLTFMVVDSNNNPVEKWATDACAEFIKQRTCATPAVTCQQTGFVTPDAYRDYVIGQRVNVQNPYFGATGVQSQVMHSNTGNVKDLTKKDKYKKDRYRDYTKDKWERCK